MSLKNLLNKPPLSLEQDIYNYIEKKDAYVENYDRIAQDDLVQKIMPDEVKEVLFNCCQLTVRGGSCTRYWSSLWFYHFTN